MKDDNISRFDEWSIKIFIKIIVPLLSCLLFLSVICFFCNKYIL